MRRALTRHAGGGLTYRPIAPLTLGRCAQRRSIVAIFGNKSALSAPALQQAVPRLRAALPQIRAGPAVVASRGGGYKPRRPGRHSAAPPTGCLRKTPLVEQRMPAYLGDSPCKVKWKMHKEEKQTTSEAYLPQCGKFLTTSRKCTNRQAGQSAGGPLLTVTPRFGAGMSEACGTLAHSISSQAGKRESRTRACARREASPHPTQPARPVSLRWSA